MGDKRVRLDSNARYSQLEEEPTVTVNPDDFSDEDSGRKDWSPAGSELSVDLTSDGSDESPPGRCGYFSWTPNCLQWCHTPQMLLVCSCWFGFVQSFVVNGINNVNTATYERRFHLNSTQVAWVTSIYDLLGALLSVMFGYMGMFVHKGRVLAVCAFIMAMGSFTMFLPHVLAGEYKLGAIVEEICIENENLTDSSEMESETNDSVYLSLLLLGQCFHGVAGAAMCILIPTYLDENIHITNTPFYIGVYLSFTALGPAVAYVVGGQFLNLYVDIGRVDSSEIKVDVKDPRWVGAWWIGFLLSAIASLSVAVFTACFARELPAARVHRASRKSQAHRGLGDTETSKPGFGKKSKDVLAGFKFIVSNSVWVLITLGITVHASMVVAFATFLPKAVQFQFSRSPSTAAMMVGLLFVPGAAGGHLLGGLIPKWLSLRMRGLLILCSICSALNACLSSLFLLRCDMASIAGVTVPYYNGNTSHPAGLTQPCNSDCHCNLASYEPVCGSDGMQYFSPCHAGCHEVNETGELTVFSDCSCLGNMTTDDGPLGLQMAIDDVCDQNCMALIPFLALLLLLLVITFMMNTAAQAATIRCVPDKERTMGLGLQGAIIRILGASPGPLILGALFDYACLVWQGDGTGELGGCWIYDNSSLALSMTSSLFVSSVIGTISFLIALKLYKPAPEVVVPAS